jgi:hemerythrin superfamily protein
LEKENLVKQILTELFIHSKVEEEIVYPAVKDKGEDAEDIIDEAENEHRVVKFMMAELSKMSAEDEQFEAKVTVLCELVNHHIKEEEKEMFKKLRESDADLNSLAQEVLTRKDELTAQPLPTMSCSLAMGAEVLDEDGQGEQDAGDATKLMASRKKRTKSIPKAAETKQRRSA